MTLPPRPHAALPESMVKPNRPAFESVAALAARVGAGDTVSVGGHHFARLPIALLRAVAAGPAKRLRFLSWAGGLPLEMLLEAGAVASAEICFSSLDIFGLAPRFRAAVESGSLPVTDWNALALIQALRAAQQNLPFMPSQLPAGSSLMEQLPEIRAFTDPATGIEVALVPARRIDALLLHAPRADEDGNVQIVGAKALDLAQAGAARKVLVTVEEVVPRGGLPAAGRQTVLTRNQVTAIAVAPGGAYPTSCLPFYVTDYARIADVLADPAAGLAEALAPPAAVPQHLRQAARVPARAIVPGALAPPSAPADAPATVDELMAIRLARTLGNDDFASAGAVSPLANVAYRLAKATHAPDLLIATMSCGHVDIQPGVMSLSLLESMDAQTAAAHAGGDETYSAYYQAGAVTCEIIAAAQIDARGRVNNIALRKPNGGLLRLPGQGGMADVANMHRDFIVYVPRHTPMSLVESVDLASSARGVLAPDDRRRHGWRPGKVQLLTNLCVFTLDPAQGLVVTETMPGVARDEIVQQTGFETHFAEHCAEMPPPTPDELQVLRRDIDPLGLRRLEFVGARDRTALIQEIIARDRAVLERLALESSSRDEPEHHVDGAQVLQ